MFTGLMRTQPEFRAVDPASRTGFETIFGTRQATSGVRVTVKSALCYSPWWAGISLISGDIAKIPLVTYRRVGNGKEPDRMHPAYRLLRRKPNSTQTANQWRRCMTAQAIVYGNAYSLIVRDGGARPTEMIPLDPALTRPESAGDRLFYLTQVDGMDRSIQPENIFHLRGMSLDGLSGEYVLDRARNTLGKGMAQDEYGARFFSNNAVPDHVMIHPETLDDVAIKRLQKSIRDMFGGVDKSHNVGVFEEGIKWQSLGIEPQKAQLIEGLKESVRDVARILGIPPHRLGDDTRTSFASLEQENLSYQDSTLGIWFDNFEEEAYDKLLTEEEKERESHTVEFLRNKILLADAATRTSVYASGIQNGWLNRDEVRSFENLNPIPEGGGEEFLVPANLLPASEDEPDEDPAGEPDVLQIGRSWQILFEDRTFHAVRRLAQLTARTLEGGFDKLGELQETIEANNRKAIAGYYSGLIEAVEHAGGRGLDGEAIAKRLINCWRASLDVIAKEKDRSIRQTYLNQITNVTRDGTASFVQSILEEIKWNGDTNKARSK